MLSLPAHDLWAEYSFPLHAWFYHVLERPQSWCFQWNTRILIIRVNKCFVRNYLLVNTLMIHKDVWWETAGCRAMTEHGSCPVSDLSHANSGEGNRKWMSYILLFLPLLWLPLITELRQSWLQRLCSTDLVVYLKVLSNWSRERVCLSELPSVSKYLSDERRWEQRRLRR